MAPVPSRKVGPIKIIGTEVNTEVNMPLATYETPLWPSTSRGARVTRLSGGIQTIVVQDFMSRSVAVEAPNALYANEVIQDLNNKADQLSFVVESTSRFAKLKDWHHQIVGKLIYIRFSVSTGDASGHNMVTKAAEALLNWILKTYSALKYVSISGNFCTDKKVSAVNGILGRGKYVVAETTIPRAICETELKTTPEKIVDLHIKKNLIGTMIAGGLRSANAHFANILFAAFLTTGQDVANIIEASQGMVHAEVQQGDLYFSITLPNLIVGSVGNGKHLPFVQHNLQQLGCLEEREPGANGRRLAIIIAATVLCGELSLLAAQTNPGELMRSHIVMERLASHEDKQKRKETVT